MFLKNTILVKNPCAWYLGAWCLYYLQGTLYPVGSLFARLLILVLILVSLLHAYRVFQTPQKPIYFKGLNAMIIMYTVYGLFLFVTDGMVIKGIVKTVPTFYYLKEHYMALLPIYSCYYYTKKGYLTEKLFSLFSVLFVVVGIAYYFHIQMLTMEMLASQGNYVDEVTNNSGYAILAVLPSLLVLRKKPVIQYVAIGVCVVFIVLSVKRGAMLCSAIFLLLFARDKMKNSKGGKKVAVLLAIAIGFVFFSQFVLRRLEASDYFAYRVEQTIEGQSSGRDGIYNNILNHYFNNSTFFQKILGRGANGTIKTFTNYAHNDWLEILTNQGLLGIIIFLSYCICFVKTIKRKKKVPDSRLALLVIFIIFLLQTFFSAGITNTVIFTSSMMGFALADGFYTEDSSYI